MFPTCKRFFRRFLLSGMQFLKSRKWIAKTLYSLQNAKDFSDLQEHEIMVADTIRIDSYHQAIKRYVKPGDIVLDLGTGTGILSLFAAQQNPEKIYAIDHSEFIGVAKKIAILNSIDKIDFIKESSFSFTPTEKVDVILHEQVGDDLFEEDMLENILDLKKRILKNDGIILPGKFELFLEPVSLKETYRVPFIWEQHLHGIDFRYLRNDPIIEPYKLKGYACTNIPPHSINTLLCNPEPILAFDMNEKDFRGDFPTALTQTKKVVRRGRMDGLCLYFRIVFDDEIAIDTLPMETSTHWKNRLFRTESRQVEPGQDIPFTLFLNNLTQPESWSIALQNID